MTAPQRRVGVRPILPEELSRLLGDRDKSPDLYVLLANAEAPRPSRTNVSALIALARRWHVAAMCWANASQRAGLQSPSRNLRSVSALRETIAFAVYTVCTLYAISLWVVR